jgi:two-component system, NarL family, nitrate/nitrite response regulator NarL
MLRVKPAPIRVLVVSDVRLYRDGLSEIFAGEPRLRVVGAAADAASAARLAAEQRAEVALVDMAMPQSSSAVGTIAAATPGVKVVALGVREHERDLVACAEAGVAGYVPRAASVQDLVTVLEGVGRGELVCSAQTAATLWKSVVALARSGRSAPAAGAVNSLTPREREIGALLEAGLSNKDIAVRLGIEVATVKNHVHNLLDKLQVHRRGQAAARLLRDGWIGRRATPVP